MPSPDTCMRVLINSIGCVKFTVNTQAVPPRKIDSKREGVFNVGEVAMAMVKGSPAKGVWIEEEVAMLIAIGDGQ